MQKQSTGTHPQYAVGVWKCATCWSQVQPLWRGGGYCLCLYTPPLWKGGHWSCLETHAHTPFVKRKWAMLIFIHMHTHTRTTFVKRKWAMLIFIHMHAHTHTHTLCEEEVGNAHIYTRAHTHTHTTFVKRRWAVLMFIHTRAYTSFVKMRWALLLFMYHLYTEIVLAVRNGDLSWIFFIETLVLHVHISAPPFSWLTSWSFGNKAKNGGSSLQGFTSHFRMQISFLSHIVWLLFSLISYIHYQGEGRELSMSLVLSSLPYEKCMHFAHFSCLDLKKNPCELSLVWFAHCDCVKGLLRLTIAGWD